MLVCVQSVCELKVADTYLLIPNAAPMPCACRWRKLVRCTLLGQAAAALCKALPFRWKPPMHGMLSAAVSSGSFDLACAVSC